MKAIRVHAFGGPEVLKLEDIADPKAGPGDVVVRVRAAGVNPVDAYMHTGTYARKPPLPYTPGFDGAGDVESVGADVKGVAKGDRVYIAGPGNTVSGAGTYAERAICLPSQLHRLPARTSYAQGAALGVPYCTAYRALFQRARGPGLPPGILSNPSQGMRLCRAGRDPFSESCPDQYRLLVPGGLSPQPRGL